MRPKTLATCARCEKPAVARGFCKLHWEHARKSGELVPRPRDVASRFWRKVAKGGACWIWSGARTASGYGLFKPDGRRIARPVLAHRFAVILDGRKLRNAQVVCHHCDNPPCVRPDHLFIGTKRDNARDRETKGRGHDRRREKNPRWWKYTPEKATEAKRLRALGYTQEAIGKAIGLHQSHVSKILRGIFWPFG